MSGIHVVKLGGSLLDLADLLPRLQAFLPECGPRPLLLVGGGDAADLVRRWDAAHPLGDERGHWLAVRAMQLNAHLLAAALRGSRLVCQLSDCAPAWSAGELALIDPLPWLEREETRGIRVPHRWSFTSDSIAAHVARQVGAARLTLLKSTLPPGDCGLACAAGLGVVDGDFAEAAANLPAVELVNLRAHPPRRCVLS